jgi:hypothetical protein
MQNHAWWKKNKFENVFKRVHCGYLKKTLNTPNELYSTHFGGQQSSTLCKAAWFCHMV